eukprot:3203581-Lingulodinium_polyedra.AAC.1
MLPTPHPNPAGRTGATTNARWQTRHPHGRGGPALPTQSVRAGGTAHARLGCWGPGACAQVT